MEQIYLVEIFIDKVTIFASEEDEKSGANKNLIIKIKFGPKVEFIIKEGQLAMNDENKEDIIECDQLGRRKWTRTIRVGKSYLFPSYPDTLLMILSKFPLEIEVWNDDENEVEIFVGIGTMHWETQFFHMLKESAEPCKIHESLTIKQLTPLFAECCCKQVGEIAFILRLSPLGDSIITEFQQLMKDPDVFVFRTNKTPSMFQCKRIEGDDPNFCMVGSLYETTTLEDPDIVKNAQKKIEICTELQSCGIGQKGQDYRCEHKGESKEETKKLYPIDKIRMGDITGPCGNTNCPLAHKVKAYIRNLEMYKREAAGKVTGTKGEKSRKVCGACDCKDDRFHREGCPEKEAQGKVGGSKGHKAMCSGCGGTVTAGDTCEDRKNKSGESSVGNKQQISYVISVTKVPDFKESVYGKEFTIQSLAGLNPQYQQTSSPDLKSVVDCSYRCLDFGLLPISNITSSPNIRTPENKASTRSLGISNQLVFNAELKESRRKLSVYNCTQAPDIKDCKCDPPKRSPPCKTFDCDCIAESSNMATRKSHRPYCPSYKHKNNCPVMRIHADEEDKKKIDDDEDETEPLPYGLPPIQLGPCPVIGKPCTNPDGFARMYKTAVLPAQPPSYSDAGKVCCSKEYERIKNAIKEYMKKEKENDFRCVNRFNVDNERRCCDKEQTLMGLVGKSCCGSHKMAIQDKQPKEEKK